MAGYQFTVMHGDTAIPVSIDSDGDIDDAALQAAATAAMTMRSKPYVVYGTLGMCHGTFTQQDVDEWWA